MSHDRGVATKAETHRAARWQGAGRGGRGAEPPGQGPLPPLYGAPSASAAHEQLNAPVANAAANPPRPASRRPLGLGQGVKRLSRGVVRPPRWAQAGAASSWTWPSMGATSPTAGGVCVSPVSLPSLRAWARACRRE